MHVQIGWKSTLIQHGTCFWSIFVWLTLVESEVSWIHLMALILAKIHIRLPWAPNNVHHMRYLVLDSQAKDDCFLQENWSGLTKWLVTVKSRTILELSMVGKNCCSSPCAKKMHDKFESCFFIITGCREIYIYSTSKTSRFLHVIEVFQAS